MVIVMRFQVCAMHRQCCVVFKACCSRFVRCKDGGKMCMCGYADVATGKIWRKMRINIHILPAHAPSVTGILKSLTFHSYLLIG